MDLSKDVLMELILNVVGYLAAGGLSLVLYSLYRDRKKTALTTTGSKPQPGKEKHNMTGSIAGKGNTIEFITFSEQTKNNDISNISEGNASPASMMTAASRGDRVEVIRLARKMIEAGAIDEKVRSVLPISEAELALLNCRKN